MAIPFFLLAPLLVLIMAQRVPALDRIGVVPLTFALGFLLTLAVDLEGLFGPGFAALQTTLSEVSVALALPLIIFAANIRKALSDARGVVTAILAAFVSVVVVSLLGVVLFADHVPHVAQVAALSVGAYTGSGVNMGAINTAIAGNEDVFLTMITYDIVFSVVYMIVVLLAGQRLAGLVLRPYAGARDGSADMGGMDHLADESAHGYRRILARESLPGSALVILAAVLAVGIAVGVATLFPEAYSSVVTILTITTLGLIGSLVPRLHSVKSSFHLGMYLILVFCFASATMLDTKIFTQMDWGLGGYFLFVIFGSMVLQALLCRVLNVDRDTYLVASAAAVMSVPFIPVIAGALKNRALLVPGIAIAVLGYAVGNYLGVMVAGISGTLLP